MKIVGAFAGKNLGFTCLGATISQYLVSSSSVICLQFDFFSYHFGFYFNFLDLIAPIQMWWLIGRVRRDPRTFLEHAAWRTTDTKAAYILYQAIIKVTIEKQ